MASLGRSRRGLLAGACLALAHPASAQNENWLNRIEVALSGQADISGGVSRLHVALPDASTAELRWSSDVGAFMTELAKIAERAAASGTGYDVATGTNRLFQTIQDGRSSASEHWMDHCGMLRMITVTTADPTRSNAMLDEFSAFRNAGGFGGPVLLTPPLTAPED